MDQNKDFYEIYISALKLVFEEVFSTKFELKASRNTSTDKNLNDIAAFFEVSRPNLRLKVVYFFDRKFVINLIKEIIHDIDSFDLNSDFTSRVILEVNNLLNKNNLLNTGNIIIKKKSNDKAEKHDYIFSGIELIKGYDNLLPYGKTELKMFPFHSSKGDFALGFVLSEAKEKSDKVASKKTSDTIIQKKSFKDDMNTSGSILSAVEFLEIKKAVIMSLNELKDLKGDHDFLIRKAKAVSELSRLWLDLIKEEN